MIVLLKTKKMNQLPPALLAKFDQMFLTMTQESGGLNPFLDCMFSFLQRRTDFYYEAEPGDRMGFPPGYSEQLVSQRLLSKKWLT